MLVDACGEFFFSQALLQSPPFQPYSGLVFSKPTRGTSSDHRPEYFKSTLHAIFTGRTRTRNNLCGVNPKLTQSPFKLDPGGGRYASCLTLCPLHPSLYASRPAHAGHAPEKDNQEFFEHSCGREAEDPFRWNVNILHGYHLIIRSKDPSQTLVERKNEMHEC